MALVALTLNLVTNHARSHLLNSSGGGASGVLLRALGIPRMSMQIRALSATAKEPLVFAHGDSYQTYLQLIGGTPVESKRLCAGTFRRIRDFPDGHWMGAMVEFREGHKMEMKQLPEGLKSLMKSLIKNKDEDEAAQVPITKKNKRIHLVPNRDYNDDKLECELSRRQYELFDRPEVKRNLEKFVPGIDPCCIEAIPLPLDAPRGAKAFVKLMGDELLYICLSLKIMIPYDPVINRFLVPRDDVDVL